MSPLDLNALPNPPNSPIEKLLPDTMWENIEPRIRDTLSENPTRDEILRAFSYYDRVLADYIQRHEQAMTYWANIHTHAGFSDGAVAWNPNTAVIVAHTGLRQTATDCVCKAFGGYGQLLWSAEQETQMVPGAYGSPDGMLYSWGSDAGSAVDAGFFRFTDPANSGAWEWVAMTPQATPNNGYTVSTGGGWVTYYDKVRNRLHLFGSGTLAGGSGPQWIYLDLSTGTVTDVGWALPLRGVAEIRRVDDDNIIVVASTNTSAVDSYLYLVDLAAETVTQHPTTIAYADRGYRSVVFRADLQSLLASVSGTDFRWYTGDLSALSELRQLSTSSSYEFFLWQDPRDLNKVYAWGHDVIDELAGYDITDLSTPEWTYALSSSNDRPSIPLVATSAFDRVLSGTRSGYVELWNLPTKQDGYVWRSDEELSSNQSVSGSEPVGALGVVQEFDG